MYLTGYVQRDKLFEVATRWFQDDVHPDDGRFLTKVLLYESLISGPASRRFLTDILQQAHRCSFYLERVHRKDDLREAIISGCPEPTTRMQSLFGQYLDFPEEFFRRTPADIVLAMGDDSLLLGMMRFKRVRRVAERASRRLADLLSAAIEGEARKLAHQRAAQRGIELNRLISSADTMRKEFAEAERIVSEQFRRGEAQLHAEDLGIEDAVGFKFVGPVEKLAQIEALIAKHPRADIVQRTEHRGRYNDINLLVDLTLPPAGEIVQSLKNLDWSFASGRGLGPEELAREFPEYLLSGARTVQAEVVLTTYEELVEAEFGRAIHEERILSQRHTAVYNGRIAANATFLIEYLLMLAISPTVVVDRLPVKMWGRYLPDTFSRAVWKLFGIEHGGVLYDPFVLDTQELRDSKTS